MFPQGLFATGLADAGRHEFYAVADVQRVALFPIVRRAERNDVPIAVARIVPLNVRTHCCPLDARYLRAIRGKRLATEFLPVLEPATAFAGVIADAVNVAHSHDDFFSCCLAVICDWPLKVFSACRSTLSTCRAQAERRRILGAEQNKEGNANRTGGQTPGQTPALIPRNNPPTLGAWARSTTATISTSCGGI